jgi:DNA processing protein
MDEVRHWLELSLIPGVGPKTFFKLLDHFGSPLEALRAPASALRQTPEVSAAVAEAVAAGSPAELEKTLLLLDQRAVEVITYNSPNYPERLKTIHDPPPLLYVKGTIHPEDANSISIVGSRRATHYGRMAAGKLAGDLARLGVTVVSGLAYGVDAAAHKGALEAGGRTIAVLGCGVDVVYPRAPTRSSSSKSLQPERSSRSFQWARSPTPVSSRCETGSSADSRSARSLLKLPGRAER